MNSNRTKTRASQTAAYGIGTLAQSHLRSNTNTENRTRIPNFFIIGAPKAGTTSLYSYLATHPRVFMPKLKEPFYFCSDFPAYRERATFVDSRERYLKLFARAGDQHLAVGEASSLYLFSQVAVPDILELQPAARFIVMLRNPIDLAHSFHSQLFYSLHESVADFEEAWRLQTERNRGKNVPPHCLEPALLQYRDLAMLGEQLARLLQHVNSGRIKVLLFDDFVADPRRCYREVLEFLGVPSDNRTDFPQENAHKIRRSRRLAQFLRRPPFPLRLLRDSFARHAGPSNWPIRMVRQLNQKPGVRTQLSPHFRSELARVFYDDVRQLEHLIDRDLSHWIER